MKWIKGHVISTDSYRKEYDQRYEKNQRLKEEILYILKRELDSQDIPYHSLEGRIKTFDFILFFSIGI